MKKIIPNLFFLFLTAPILSPFVGGVTIYLSSIILFFDVSFLLWAINKFSRDTIIITLALSFLTALSCLNVVVFVKILMLLSSVVYMFYCYEKEYFYLYRWAVVNVIVAVAQFVLIFIDPAVAYLIGPTNIANVIWGPFAGPTFTNFYAISILPRVSGLSREGGFFASLLGVVFFVIINDPKVNKKKKKIYLSFIIIGIIISISKTTTILLIVPVILLLKKYINIIEGYVVAILYAIVLIFFFNYILLHTSFFYDELNISLIQRFSGYALTPYAGISDYIRGTNITSLMLNSRTGLEAIVAELKDESLIDFCGLPALYLGYGIITFAFFLLFTKFLKLRGAGLAIIIILTTNVVPITNDGFVVISWFFGCFISYNYSKKAISDTHQLTI
ncbi:hypothetical protein [Mucilaginibacter sp. L196]|uniref:hypothetical protein n=1 Tax=Mucilaginibacter sp. L196 TaxID=1641870 RepID=UPI00131A845E|nr:hypothetical protein [Mucilaginibacter sp. L196]